VSTEPIELTLAHSPDPDDAFMWWPITGRIDPSGKRLPGPAGEPAINTGRVRFRAIPADIEVLNRRAATSLEADLFDITALSVRTYADVTAKYAITTCGASFGDGFGPKLVCRDPGITIDSLRKSLQRIAVPGKRTTAFMMLGMILGPDAMRNTGRFVEMPFDQIIGAVTSERCTAGLVIHEGQLTFADAGLQLLVDVGSWWKARTNLKLPLGINAVRRDLDARLGRGATQFVADLLRKSVAYSMDRWDESVAYTMPFAQANVTRGGGLPPTLERLDQYCRMYVSAETRDMGEPGRAAIERLLAEGAKVGLAPTVGTIQLV
jgi:1,4-dihydroxy-6-naphthoate synthase